MRRKYLLSILPFLILSCSLKEEIKEKSLPDQIVLIIDKCPNYSSHIYEPTGILSKSENDYELTYRDDDLVLHFYKTKEIPTKDTVVFPARSEMVEIEHFYKHYDNLSFIFRKGDTVLFSYENDFPVAKVINRSEDSVQVNYEKIKHDYLLSDHETFDGVSKFRIHPLTSYPRFLALRDPDKWRQIKLDSMEKALSIAKLDREKEAHLLDSLQKQGFLSKEAYDFYNTKSNVELGLITYGYLNYKEENTLAKETKSPKWPFENTDSLVRYGYYNYVLDYMEREIFNPGYISKTLNMKIPDYRVMYSAINQNKQLSEKEKKVLLTRTIKNIINNFSQAEIKEYFERYKSDVGSQALLSHVIKEYQEILPDDVLSNIDNSEIQISSTLKYDLSLLDVNGGHTDLEKILNKHKGKLIYVDFWASHCLPCMLAIPYSKDLDAMYLDQDLQIVYISIDKDLESWNKASKKLAIDDYPEHYLVDSTKVNTMLTGIKLKAIPRHLLFDKKGKLVHTNAPGPKIDEIRVLFDQQLSVSN